VKTLVVDASVAAKWFLPPEREPLSENAVALLRRYSQGDIQFVVPDLFWVELANVFWKAVRSNRWSQSDAASAANSILEQRFPTVAATELLVDALPIACTFQRSVYDSLHVALAMASKTHLITADERLANSLAAYFPVKWLGAMA
jgi:predicted nucleic acid-binding protein